MKLQTEEIADQLIAVLKQEGMQFIENSQGDVATLGEDLVNAIFHQAVFTAIEIPELPVSPSPEIIAKRQEIVEARARVNQLIAKAQLEHTEAVKNLKDRARQTALKIGSAIAGVAIGSLKGFLS